MVVVRCVLWCLCGLLCGGGEVCAVAVMVYCGVSVLWFLVVLYCVLWCLCCVFVVELSCFCIDRLFLYDRTMVSSAVIMGHMLSRFCYHFYGAVEDVTRGKEGEKERVVGWW